MAQGWDLVHLGAVVGVFLANLYRDTKEEGVHGRDDGARPARRSTGARVASHGSVVMLDYQAVHRGTRQRGHVTWHQREAQL